MTLAVEKAMWHKFKREQQATSGKAWSQYEADPWLEYERMELKSEASDAVQTALRELLAYGSREDPDSILSLELFPMQNAVVATAAKEKPGFGGTPRLITRLPLIRNTVAVDGRSSRTVEVQPDGSVSDKDDQVALRAAHLRSPAIHKFSISAL